MKTKFVFKDLKVTRTQEPFCVLLCWIRLNSVVYWYKFGETLSIEGNASVYNAVDAFNGADNIALLTSTIES